VAAAFRPDARIRRRGIQPSGIDDALALAAMIQVRNVTKSG
jgi:hypothetical protein